MTTRPKKDLRLAYIESRLHVEHDQLKRDLESRLRSLAYDIERAQKALATDDHITPIILNAVGIDAYIARWNLTRELCATLAAKVNDE